MTENVDEGTLTLKSNSGRDKQTLSYERPDGEHLTLEGSLEGDRLLIEATLQTNFPLLEQRFHWVIEN